ncbi:MAG: hypothetical protein U0R19_33735 [Bryobacteraceae bacterium]
MAEPLRQKNPNDGSIYQRPPSVEAALDALLLLPIDQFVQRCAITSRSDPAYVPSECLLHVLRRVARLHNSEHFQALFGLMRQRIQKALPPVERFAPGDTRPSESAAAVDIRDAVVALFEEKLCRDRTGYEEHLDFFEVRFNMAIARERLTARRKVTREQNRESPLYSEEEPGEHTREVEEALVRLQRDPVYEFEQSDYRRRLVAAIDLLPDNQRRVIELQLQDISIDSNDPDEITMAKILGCAEKTVRNRRDRAYAALRKLLSPKGGSR